MVGVGSGSALNAFNIGQTATQPTAVGMAISDIVTNAEKQGLLEAQSGAQTAGSIATAQFKDTLANAPKDVYIPGQSGGLTIIEGVPGGGSNVKSQAALPGLLPGMQVNPTQPGAGEVRRFNASGDRVDTAPAAGGGGTIDLNSIDPNAELTAEQEAAIRKALNM